MASPLRIEVPDGICHVSRRGLDRRAIVRDDADRRRWLGLLEGMATRRSWRESATTACCSPLAPHPPLSQGAHLCPHLEGAPC
jgi:hypothetical protein